jgi:hypothetical protein
MIDKQKLPGNTLTVIIRDDSPLIFCDDTPRYRSVQLKLTDEQRNDIALKLMGTNCGNDVYESISSCFIEDKK